MYKQDESHDFLFVAIEEVEVSFLFTHIMLNKDEIQHEYDDEVGDVSSPLPDTIHDL